MLKLHAGCLFIPMLRQLACSDCYILGFFTNKININKMNLKEKILEFTSDDGILYQSEELVDFIKSLINDKINKTIEKIESETLSHYDYEEVIGILEDLKIEEQPE